MKKICKTDVWTEQYQNHHDICSGAFVDGIDGERLPYDKVKIVRNCNCLISSNSDKTVIGNKHNAIVFYKNGEVVRLAVLMKNTDVEKTLSIALNQNMQDIRLKDLLEKEKVEWESIDLKEKPIYNQFNGQNEMDTGSCDRLSLLSSLLKGDYTQDESSFGNYGCNEYDFFPDIEVCYNLKTDEEIFEIRHKGAFINKTKTKIVIIQEKSGILLSEIEKIIGKI